jgi:hypothetical protein
MIQTKFKMRSSSTTTTVLSESTDPNILYNLKRDILAAGIFDMDAVVWHYGLLIEKNDNNQAKVAGLLDRAVDEFKKLDGDERDEFAGKVDDFVRRYSFVAQLFSFGDASLEQFYEYTRNLRKKLPKTHDPMPEGLIEEIDLSSLAITKGVNHEIRLSVEEGELEPISADGRGGKKPDEMERLSLIIKGINEQYGLPADMEASGLELVMRIRERDDLQSAIKNNPRGAAETYFHQVMEEERMKMYSKSAEFFQALDSDPALRENLARKLFNELYSVKK